jgi:hypothetical protein
MTMMLELCCDEDDNDGVSDDVIWESSKEQAQQHVVIRNQLLHSSKFFLTL